MDTITQPRRDWTSAVVFAVVAIALLLFARTCRRGQMSDKAQAPAPNAGSPDPAAIASDQILSESKKKLMAFEIAESAKEQVTTWAKWIVGAVIAVGATLGVKTYLDVQGSIKDATDTQIRIAQAKATSAIGAFEQEQQVALKDFREKSKGAITSFEAEITRVVQSVQDAGHKAACFFS